MAPAHNRLHLVASSGGHLELIAAVRSALAPYERVWVTPDSDRARNLLASGERLGVVTFYGRNPLRLIRHLAQVIRLIARERPRTVITAGAGTAVPFCLISRLLGAKVIFVETMARVTGASISGRVLSRLAAVTLVQWPEMLRVYDRARLCSPALLSEVDPETPRTEGTGTFVAVGTHFQPFDRLLDVVDRAVGDEILPKPATGQAGTSTLRARHLLLAPFMRPEELSDAIAGSRYVVCHAGSGIIASALRAGRKPLVMARRRGMGEHVDDHQMQIVEKLAAMRLVVPIEDEIAPRNLAEADQPLDHAAQSVACSLPSIEDALSDALHGFFGPSARCPQPTPLDEVRRQEALSPGDSNEKARAWTW